MRQFDNLKFFETSGIIISMLKEGYPGNPQLPESTKFRIESSFRQAVSLYLNGNMEDCIMGCDFILKMDPQFEPAKILIEKAKNPNFETDLSQIIEKYGPQEEINVEELLIQAIELYNNREFEKTLEILTNVLLKDPNNTEAKDMFERAKEKLEIQAFVVQFAKRAKEYFEEGSIEDSLKEINKGLALDETNPELLSLKEKIDNLKKEPEKIEEKKEEIIQEKIEVEKITVEEPPTPFIQEENQEAFKLEKEPYKEEIIKPMPALEKEEIAAPGEEFEISQPTQKKQPSAQMERIESLLNEGMRSFQLGEYQEAIDIWSRIFLIDMNNEEAAKRIDEAKLKIAEEERKVEEYYNNALSLFQQGKKEEAKKIFQDILAIEPHHIGARNYLKQMEEETIAQEPIKKVEEQPISLEEILPEMPKKVEIEKVERKKKKILIPISVVSFVILVLVVGWFLMEGGKEGQKQLSPDLLLTKAQGLMTEGKWEEALAELLQIKPEAKEYPQAIELMTKIKGSMANKKKETTDGRPVDVVFKEYKDKAYEAYKQKDYVLSEEYYKKAQELKPLSFEDKAYFDDVQKVLSQINSAKSYFASGNLEQAISILSPIYKEEKVLQAKELLILANYNLGISKLKEEKLMEAQKYFLEVLVFSPDDEEVKKHLKFIERYSQETRKDLLYQIYLKYITER
mgnify:CR=1 FL=1